MRLWNWPGFRLPSEPGFAFQGPAARSAGFASRRYHIEMIDAHTARFCSQAIDFACNASASQAVCRGFDSHRPLQDLAAFRRGGFAAGFASYVPFLLS